MLLQSNKRYREEELRTSVIDAANVRIRLRVVSEVSLAEAAISRCARRYGLWDEHGCF